MKILVLYSYRGQKSGYNHWCNVDFYKMLNNFKDVEVKYYGRRVHELFPEHIVCEFDSSLLLTRIRERFNFDVIIVAGRNRAFYSHTEDKMWIPKDYYEINCPKILVEPDYHKYRKYPWFNEMQFDVILHRHQSNVVRGIEDFPDKSHIWFPFSVDPSVFHPYNRYRKNIVCFVGNSKSKSYYFRKIASKKLEEEGLLNFKGIQIEDDYITTLQENTIYLNGASNFTIDCAKTFEIIASGGILFTNKCYNGFRELFKNCFVEYKGDFSDIIQKAKAILNNPEKQKKIIAKGLKIINKKHTHYHRCKELLTIIKTIKVKPDIIKYVPTDVEKEINVNCQKWRETAQFKTEKDIEPDVFRQIKLLLKNKIKICLLKNTCYEHVIGDAITLPLTLGVSNLNLAQKLIKQPIILEKIPRKTKHTNFHGLGLNVPSPVIRYLQKLYGKNFMEKQ